MGAGGINDIPTGVASSSSNIEHGKPSVTELADMPASKSAKHNPVVEEVDVNADSSAEPGRSSEESARKETLCAAGVGLTEDDPNLPCLTIRMWVIGIGFCLLGSGVNTLYTFRIPSITLSQSAIQFLAYPIGNAWYLAVPQWKFFVLGQEISLNPGPFNYKVCQPSITRNRSDTILTMRLGKHPDLYHGQSQLPYQTQCRCAHRATCVLWAEPWMGIRNHHDIDNPSLRLGACRHLLRPCC